MRHSRRACSTARWSSCSTRRTGCHVAQLAIQLMDSSISSTKVALVSRVLTAPTMRLSPLHWRMSSKSLSSAGLVPSGWPAITAFDSVTGTAVVTPHFAPPGLLATDIHAFAVLSEVSPNGEEYFRFFRQECRRHNLKIVALETVSQTPANLTENLDNLRQSNPDALCYMGYGMLAAQGFLRKALDELAWDPPRIMGTAFMFYLMGFDKFEGWVGIDQFDPNNTLIEGFHQRYVERHQADPPMWPNAIPVLAYDTARVLAEGLFRAPSLSGPGLKDGLEKIRFMPSTTGGPRTHIAAAPYEHGMFRGDWLLYGRVRNAKLEFEGLFEPSE